MKIICGTLLVIICVLTTDTLPPIPLPVPGVKQLPIPPVPSPARNLKWDCFVPGKSKAYSGKKRTTGSGIPCQNWSSNYYHKSDYPDLPENFCRDPNGRGFPWCYTEDPHIQWMSCGIEFCPPGNKPNSCRDLKKRGHSKDGEYNIWPPKLPYQKIKVYCHNITANPSEYLTFKYLTYGATFPSLCNGETRPQDQKVFPYARTVYRKIRLDIFGMELDVTDSEFAEVHSELIPFAQAYDCHARHISVNTAKPGCYPVGHFHTDLRDTDFHFSSSIVSDFDIFGNDTFRKVYVQQNTSYVKYFNLECGGFCGGCVPKRNLKIYTRNTNGGWSSWQRGFPCGYECSAPEQMRTQERECTKPRPTGTGRKCKNSTTRNTNICITGCPVDGGWGNWKYNTSSCSTTCGAGSIHTIRYRMCDNPRPKFGGKYCIGQNIYEYTQKCLSPCPVDGGWSRWEMNRGHCSVTCGGPGKQTSFYYRDCDNPKRSPLGKPCKGRRRKDEKTTDCQAPVPCPVDGKWGDWKQDKFEGCSMTCGEITGNRRITEIRECNNPSPQYGGQGCPGNNRRSRQESCKETMLCPVDGDWGSWVMLSRSDCSSTCGDAGVESVSFKRSCDNPSPQLGGRQCFGEGRKNYTQECLSGVICEETEEPSEEGSGMYSGAVGWSDWAKAFEHSCASDCIRDIVYKRICMDAECEGKSAVLITQTCKGDYCKVVMKASSMSVSTQYALFAVILILLLLLATGLYFVLQRNQRKKKKLMQERIAQENPGLTKD